VTIDRKAFFQAKNVFGGRKKRFLGRTLMDAISAGMEEEAIASAVFLRKFTKALDFSGLVCYNDDR